MALLTPDDFRQPTESVPTPAVAHPRQAEIDSINNARTQAGYKPIGNNDNATIDAAYQHAQKNNYLAPKTTTSGGIVNQADNTTVTKETADYEPINDMLKAMQDQGMTYGQAFERYYPKPTANTGGEELIRKQQKTALFADMMRLVTEGVGANKGATVTQRDQRNPYTALQAKLAQEYAQYAKNMTDWQAKGVDVAMKDMQMRADLYKTAPKTKTTQEDKSWDRSKFDQEQQAGKDKMLNDNKQKALDRANARKIAAGHDATTRENKDPKTVEYILNATVHDTNSGRNLPSRVTYSVPKSAEKSVVGNIYNEMVNKYRDVMAKDESLRTPSERKIANDIGFMEKVYTSPMGSDVGVAIQTKLNNYPDIVAKHMKPYRVSVTSDAVTHNNGGQPKPKSIYDKPAKAINSIYDKR
jgi:hypothetical protein